MTSTENPYISGVPVGGGPAFVGRTALVREILQVLRSPDRAALFLYGQRGIGKTSLLQHLSAFLDRDASFAPVYFDLNGMASLRAEEVLNRLTRRMARTLKLPLPESRDPDPLTAFRETVLPHVRDHLPGNRIPVLLIDEFDIPAAVRPDTAFTDFYPFVQRLLAEQTPWLRFVFAIGRRPADLTDIHQTLFRDAPLYPVAMLPAKETARLIRLSETNQSLQWPENQVAAVQEMTGGHPALTHTLCRTIWEKIHKNGGGVPAVQSRDVGQAFPEAIRKAEPLFEWLWSGLSPWERMLASLLAEEGNGFMPRETLEAQLAARGISGRNGRAAASLKNWGILRNENEGYSFRVPMFTRWIMATRSLDQVRKDLEQVAERLFLSAREHCRNGRSKEGILQLRQALEINPVHFKTAALLATLLLKQKKYTAAVRILEPVYIASPRPVRPLYIRALLRQAGATADADKAANLYEYILSIAPDHLQASLQYRRLLERQGDGFYDQRDYTTALEFYRKAGSILKANKVESMLQQIASASRNKKRKRRGFSRWMLRIACVMLLLLAGGLYAAYTGYQRLTADLPRINSLKDYQPPIVTTVYADDGRKIAEFAKERRYVVPLDEMSPMLINAFIAAEDARYFTHEGVDLFGIARAFFKNIEAGTIVQGGSTITQQVIKSFLLTPERSYERKMKEAILAYRIDKAFTKNEILFLYLNQIYMGSGAYGVEAAARTYFGKSTSDLTLAECALLAGLAKAPSKDSPVHHPERAKDRRQYVLDRLVEEHYITAGEARKAAQEPIRLQPEENLFLERVPYFAEHVRRYVGERYGWDALYEEGLTIYTTVDIELQEKALKEVETGLQALEKRHRYKGQRPQGALICMETGTGHVKAMVGGRDFTDNQFNRAIQARRQPGSAFKPIIYAAALDKGYTPVSLLHDDPLVLPDNGKYWRPSNYDHRFYGPVRLRRALAKSRNIPVVRVLRDIGIDYARGYAKKLGISSELNRGLSLALGASGVSLLEMVQSYSVFANNGRLVAPVFITRIIDRHGMEIQPVMLEPEQVIEESTAFLMTSLLQSVVQNGTGYKVKALGRPTAGKTGTTNDYRDAWFIGYTPEYVTGTWVGFDRERPLGRSETGSRAASPIWLSFMQTLMADKPVQDFEVPETIEVAQVDMDTGLLAGPMSYHVVEEYFKKGTLPRRPPAPQYIVSEPEDFFKAGL